MNDIIDHRWNEEIKEYEFEVTWQRCRATDTTWETANSFNISSSARRCLIQYMNANLPEADAQKIRVLSAGSRKRNIIPYEDEEILPQVSMPDQGEICTKNKETLSLGLEYSSLEPDEL